MSQKEILLAYLREARGVWIPGYKLRSINTPDGWIGHQGDRLCRLLVAQGAIERCIINKYVNYRAKKPKAHTIYKVQGLNKQIKIPIY